MLKLRRTTGEISWSWLDRWKMGASWCDILIGSLCTSIEQPFELEEE